jgi:NTP pyrophosphatase (non-canonical NTP hydrolase)
VLVSDYDRFVQQTDKTNGKSTPERRDIAMFGLAAEIGSVTAAIKKRLLAEDASDSWSISNEEIVLELGDVMWYCFALARIENGNGKPVNIFSHDIANLRREIEGDGERAARLRYILDPDKRAAFLEAAAAFPKRTRNMRFEDYQKIAFLTARTSGKVLVEVCLAVLSQLTATLFRHALPDIELELNQAIEDRPVNDVLGEIAWHIAALASTYGLSLGEIAETNIHKVSQRHLRTTRTPLHDRRFPEQERFPKRFEVVVVSTSQSRSRMYLNGKRLGDDLTDNAYEDDGYRFHDVMHFANVAKLGWSPVLRSLMNRKRKSRPKTDEVEDGARARIVEEAVIKAIHSEGVRLAQLRNPGEKRAKQQLFLNPSEISNQFIDFIRNFVSQLEVENNQSWEWEEAIVDGYAIFHQLRRERQGTIIVDLDKRSVEFDPRVGMTFAGQVAGLGSAVADQPQRRAPSIKEAIVRSLGLEPTPTLMRELRVTEMGGGIVSVKAHGGVQKAIWDRGVVCFRTTTVLDGVKTFCTAVALSDT